MKMKSVCQATGLTDRTVRYYIEEGLIAPFYTENYLGRKNFDFSDSDIQALSDIAVLRKFGFSVAEIKNMILHPEEILPTVKELQDRKQSLINEEQQLLNALLRLESGRTYTVAELAECLSAPVTETPLPKEDSKLRVIRAIFSFVKSAVIAMIAWLPVAICLLIILLNFKEHHYPKLDAKSIACTLLTLLPTWLTITLPKIFGKFKGRYIVRIVLLALCILTIPISSIWSSEIIQRSETTNLIYYLELDVSCPANNDLLYHELFPNWPRYFVNEKQPDGSWKTVYLDARYYYRYLTFLDYTYDIYAQWPLEKEEFDGEITRVKALFEKYAPNDESLSHYVTVSRGNYECLIIYSGAQPFESPDDNYSYYIFAYDQKSLTVRYIYCESLENGADQPYYLTLDW